MSFFSERRLAARFSRSSSLRCRRLADLDLETRSSGGDVGNVPGNLEEFMMKNDGFMAKNDGYKLLNGLNDGGSSR